MTTMTVADEIDLAYRTYRRLVEEHGLTVGGVADIRPGRPESKRYDSATGETLPVLPRIDLTMFGRPNEFVRWCRVVGADRVAVHRRGSDVCVSAQGDVDGVTVRLSSDFALLPASAFAGVEWMTERCSRGMCMVDALAETLACNGVEDRT